MRREYLLDVGVVALSVDGLIVDGIIEGGVFVGDGMEESRWFEDARGDGGENVDRVGSIPENAEDIDDDVDVDVLSQTSKLTCVR